MSNPSKTIREIATHASTPEMRQLLDGLAAEFEIQHNNQNGQWGVVFGQLQNAIADELKAMRFDLNQGLGDSEARQQKMLDLLQETQREVHALAQRQLGGNDGRD